MRETGGALAQLEPIRKKYYKKRFKKEHYSFLKIKIL